MFDATSIHVSCLSCVTLASSRYRSFYERIVLVAQLRAERLAGQLLVYC